MAKDEVLRFRCSDIQRALIASNAKREGRTMTDFILSRCLPESGGNSEPESVGTLKAVATAGTIADLKSRLGLKTAADLSSGAATPPERAPNPLPTCREDGSDLRRPFNPRRPDWYELVKRSDVYECVQDSETGQYFVQQGGRGREFPSLKSALEYCETIDLS